MHVDDPRPQVGAGPADGLFDGRHAVKRDPGKAPSQVEPWRADDLPGWLEERIQLFRLGILQQVPHEDFVALLIFLREFAARHLFNGPGSAIQILLGLLGRLPAQD